MIDFQMLYRGGLTGLRPLTEVARAWLRAEVQSERRQFVGDTLFVADPIPLIERAVFDGLQIAH